MNETQGSRRETTSLKRIAVHVVFWKDARVQESGLVVKVDLRRQMTLNLACFPSFRFSMCWEDWNGVVKMSKLLSVPEHPVCVGFLTWFCHSSTYPLGYCWVLTWPDSISFQSDAAASVYPKAARETNWSSEARARDWGGKKKKKREGLNMFKSEVGKKGWVRKKAGVKSSSWLGKVAYSILHFRSCYSDPRLLWASPEKSSFPFLHTLGTLTVASLRYWSVHTNISLSYGFILGKL